MQFSINSPQEIIKVSWSKRFTSQPHQLFFSSAIFFALIIMTLSLPILEGKSHLDFSLIHSFGLNYALFTNAFLGFLITVIPKYNAQPSININKYMLPWILYQIGVLITLFANETIGKIIVCIILFYFVSLFYTIIKNSKIRVKEDSIYINSILTLGATLLFVEALTSYDLSMLIFFNYILSIVYIIALRMVPAFYFTFTKEIPWQKPNFIKPISILLIFLVGIALQFDMQPLLKFSSFIGVIFFAYTLKKLNFYKKTPAILAILVIGFIWFEIGFIALFVESIVPLYSLKLSLHIFALGFVTTLLIGFGSRVTIGHAVPPKPIIADSITKFIFFVTQVLVIFRVISSLLFVGNYDFFNTILHFSIFIWLILFALWLGRYGKILLRL